MGRAEDNKRDKLDRILNAARELFGTRGFEGTTMDAVAAAAGVSKGSVFFHAGSKAALLNRVFQLDMGRWVADAFRPPAPARRHRPGCVPPEQQPSVLDEMTASFVRLELAMCAHRELTIVYMSQVAFAADERDRVDEVMDLLFRRLVEMLERAEANGQLRSGLDTWMLARNLFALYFVEQHLWLADRRTGEAEAAARLRPVLALQLVGFLRAGPTRDAALAAIRIGGLHRRQEQAGRRQRGSAAAANE